MSIYFVCSSSYIFIVNNETRKEEVKREKRGKGEKVVARGAGRGRSISGIPNLVKGKFNGSVAQPR